MFVLTIVSGLFVLRDRNRFRRTGKQWLGMAWLGVGDALNILLFFAAYRATTVAVAVLTHYLTPIFVAIAAPFALRERATLRTGIAVAIAFVGLALILPWGQKSGDAASSTWLGAALGAGSAVFYASNVLVNKGLARAFTPSELMFYHGVVSVLVLALFVPGHAWATLDGEHARALGVVAIGAVGPGALSGLLFVWGLRHVPASHASTLAMLEPFVATMIGVAMGQALGATAIAGGLLILAGGALVVLQPRAQPVA
jgi:drug/metabolite transporter (DMT)-like permease